MRRPVFASRTRRTSDISSASLVALEDRATRRFRPDIESLLRSESRHILVGPWLGEVGWEVLYWIPLVRWMTRRWPELRERVVVVSRGGVAHWYEGVGAQYVDLFDLYDEETFPRRLEEERFARRERGENLLKQRDGVTNWEREIAAWVGARFDEPPLPILHPVLLYRGGLPKKLVSALADAADDRGFARWNAPSRATLAPFLPERYVTVRFYHSAMMRNESSPEEAQAFAMRAVNWLAERVPVVMLDPGMETDPQHPDFEVDAEVISLAPHASFATNLEIQSRAIANSSAFVGNYGGLAFLAPHYSVQSLCFWTARGRGVPESKKGPWRDLDIALRTFNRPGWGGLVARRSDDAPLGELLAPALSG